MIVISAALTVAGIYSISADGQLIMNGISMYVIGFPVAYLIFKSTPYPSPERRTEKWTGWTWCGVFLICQGIMYGGNLLGLLFMAVFGSESSVNVVQEIVLESNFLLNFLLVVVAGPIVEELLTRKLIIDRILLYGEKTAIFVSALLFGLLHGNFYQFFYAFGIGLISGLRIRQDRKNNRRYRASYGCEFCRKRGRPSPYRMGGPAWNIGNYRRGNDGSLRLRRIWGGHWRHCSFVLFLEKETVLPNAL